MVARPTLLHAGTSALQGGDCSRSHSRLRLQSQPCGSALCARASRCLGIDGGFDFACMVSSLWPVWLATERGAQNRNLSMSGLVSAARGGQTHARCHSGPMTHNFPL